MYLAAGTVDAARNACTNCGQGGVYPGEETASINGSGSNQVNYQLDGADHNDTDDDPTPHFLGWRSNVDPDELFASGKAWGVTVRRIAAADQRVRAS